MPTYLISYDLRKKRDYGPLYDAIKSYGNWAHVLESTWAVKTTDSAKAVRDTLAAEMDGDDGLFVVKTDGEAAWRKVSCKSEWLKTNL